MCYHFLIDEEMVSYFRRRSAKMYISDKPRRFGFKIRCLTSVTPGTAHGTRDTEFQIVHCDQQKNMQLKERFL